MGFEILISPASMNPDFNARPVDKQATLWKRLINDGLPIFGTFQTGLYVDLAKY